MRHVALTTVAAFTALVAIVACEEQAPDRTLTAPDVSFAKGIGGACDDGRARLIGTQQADIWARPALDSAQNRFDLVKAACIGTPTSTTKSLMLDYIEWTIDNRLARKAGATDAMLIAHWNTVFPYAGYTGTDQPTNVPASLFTDGAVGVIDWTETGEVEIPNKAALTSYPQDANGDQRDHLFVIYPIAANCLTGTNLQQSGPCFEFGSFPHVVPKFSPKVKVGICQPHDATPLSVPALGHLSPITKITEDGGTYPECVETASAPAGSWNDGLGAIVKRLAWHAKRAVSPAPLYAVHGGLGGLGDDISPHGAVDLEVFRSTFTNDVVGQAPGAPETGSWSIVTLTPPGTILVQASLGQQASKLAVLNQAGGNCKKNCGGLYLRGNLETAGPAASDGVYEAEFDALQAQTNMKEAVFALRDTQDKDLATVTFAVRNNVNLIIYNDKQSGASKVLGNWVQNVPVHFNIQVDLNANTTTVWIDNGATPAFSGVPFVNTTLSNPNFATISADFRGIDSGTMGWDEITVVRLRD